MWTLASGGARFARGSLGRTMVARAAAPSAAATPLMRIAAPMLQGSPSLCLFFSTEADGSTAPLAKKRTRAKVAPKGKNAGDGAQGTAAAAIDETNGDDADAIVAGRDGDSLSTPATKRKTKAIVVAHKNKLGTTAAPTAFGGGNSDGDDRDEDDDDDDAAEDSSTLTLSDGNQDDSDELEKINNDTALSKEERDKRKKKLLAAIKKKKKDSESLSKQFLRIKAENPGHILLFHVGDFYEMYNEDAERGAQALDIAFVPLKRKDCIVSLAGVPKHNVNTYIERLIKKNFTVAICDQVETLEESKKRKSKVIERQVTRVITPGTVIEDNLLDPRLNHYLAAVSMGHDGQMGLSWVDVTTGAFRMSLTSAAKLPGDLARIQVKEIVFPSESPIMEELRRFNLYHVTHFDEQQETRAAQVYEKIKADALETTGIEWLFSLVDDKIPSDLSTEFSPIELASGALLLRYLMYAEREHLPRVQKPSRFLLSDTLVMDPSTRKSLELTLTIARGQRKDSLLDSLDAAVTSAGARLLQTRLQSPSTNIDTINARLDLVELFVNNPDVLADVRNALKKGADIERCLQRLSLNRGGPRDLRAIAQSLQLAAAFDTTIFQNPALRIGPLMDVLVRVRDFNELVDEIFRAINEKQETQLEDGEQDSGFIKEGYSDELDKARHLGKNSKRDLISLQTDYRNNTGIQSLSIRKNNIIGYHIEVSSTAAKKLDAYPEFVRRQVLSDKVRYQTADLNKFENAARTVHADIRLLENQIFRDLCQLVFKATGPIMEVAKVMAELDVASSLGEIARIRRYCRPAITAASEFEVVHGCHPVVANIMNERATQFVSNDCYLGGEHGRVWILTGPNMGGKSTFLRQNALLAIMAQTGSFVPAKSAKIGIVDMVFSRVGASDDLANDRSTFMVEMQETALILRNATSKSLVIMDEIGRGTSTFDGTALAWASLKYLHQTNRSRALFATHYHEVANMAEDSLSNAKCYRMSIDLFPDNSYSYTYRVEKGCASRSYGIQVARIAGIPEEVIQEAQATLAVLEEQQLQGQTNQRLKGPA